MIEKYADTILHITATDADVVVDLREALSEQQVALLRELGARPEFGVVTAANPRGEAVSGAENRDRTAEMARALAERGWPHVRAIGSSPDGSHREAGFAVWASRDDVVAIAKEWEQDAIFWFDGRAFWLVWAVKQLEESRLPLG